MECKARLRGLWRIISSLAVGLMEIEHLFHYTALAVGLKPSAMECEARLRGLRRIISSLAVGLMEIEHLFHYTALAVGLKPPAMECKARLRGLWRIIYSTIISPPEAKMERSRNSVKGSTYLRTAIRLHESGTPALCGDCYPNRPVT